MSVSVMYPSTSPILPILPKPSIIETLDYEELLSVIKLQLQQLNPDIDIDHLSEADSLSKLLEIIAYREMYLRQRINESVRAVMFFQATGADLDRLAALLGVSKRKAGESDAKLRQRSLLIFNQHQTTATAGSEASYLQHLLSISIINADGNQEIVKDAAVYADIDGNGNKNAIVKIAVLSFVPSCYRVKKSTELIDKKGVSNRSAIVRITILFCGNDGCVSKQLIDEVSKVIDKVRPITDKIEVSSAATTPVKIYAALAVLPGIGYEQVEDKVETSIQLYVESKHCIGSGITRAGVLAALYQAGVQNVTSLTFTIGDDLVAKDDIKMSPSRAFYVTEICIDLATYTKASIDIEKIDKVYVEFTPISTPIAAGYLAGTLSISLTEPTVTAEQLPAPTMPAENVYPVVIGYHVYWGKNESERLSNTLITQFVVNKEFAYPLTYAFQPDILIPDGATHILVFSVTEQGEFAYPAACKLALPPASQPQGLITDGLVISGSIISGDVKIKRATNEQDITKYILYWGKSVVEKISDAKEAKIEELSKYSSLNYAFAENSKIPDEANYLLVTSSNDTYETQAIAVALSSTRLPTHKALSIQFNSQGGRQDCLSGSLLIKQASDQNNIDGYTVYWGKNAVEKLTDQPLTYLPKNTGADEVTHQFNPNLAIPDAATHFLVFTQNAQGEMHTGISQSIRQKWAAPLHAAESINFSGKVDSDKLTGAVMIIPATDESDVDEYVLYWARIDGKQVMKLNSDNGKPRPAIANFAKQDTKLNYYFDGMSTDSVIPKDGGNNQATHFLVLTKNANGEMATGVSTAINS